MAANPKQITNLATEADGVLFSPDGKNLVFTSEVYPECGADDACNKQNLDAEKDNKVKARVYHRPALPPLDRLADRAAAAICWRFPSKAGAARDLTPGNRDVPPFSLGGPDDYAISPDGKEVCYAMNADEVPATSTNTDLFAVPIDGGEPRRRSPCNPAADNRRSIRPTASTSPSARSSAPGMRATAGA